MINFNEKYEVECTGISYEGKGICLIEDFPVFVPNLVTGEKAIIRILNLFKKYALGEVEEYIKKSEVRCNVACSRYLTCGGCNFLHIPYEMELEIKRQNVKNNFRKTAHIDIESFKIIKASDIENYRNKVVFHIDSKKKDYGFFTEKSNVIVPARNCVLVPELFKNITEYIIENSDFLDSLRGLCFRQNYDASQVSVVFICNKNIRKNIESMIKNLIVMYPNICGICMSINEKENSLVYDKIDFILYGNDYIFENISGIKYKVNNKAFLQINHLQTEVLYTEAMKMAQLLRTDIVLDLFCGIGGIGLNLAKYVRKVYGVEIVIEAVRDARYNALANGIENAEFYNTPAEKLLNVLRGKKIDVVFVDPPRKGLDKSVIEGIDELKIKKVVYVSCDSATLARDVELFVENGYELEDIMAIDLFPRTKHIETLVCLTRK